MTATVRKRKPTPKKRLALAQNKDEIEGYATSFDGTRIWYKSKGAGIPIIFCNGLGCSIFYWKHVQPYLAKDHQVVVFDWRGHGQSESPKKAEKTGIDSLSRDLQAVMKELKIKKAIIIGHSMGTQVIYYFYKKNSSKVKALIPCFGTFANPLDTFYNSSSSRYVFTGIYFFNHLFPRLAKKIGGLFSKNPLWFQMGSALKMLNPGLVDRKVLKEYIDHFSNTDPVLLANLGRSMQEYNAEPTLKKIKVPTLILAAEKDTFTPVWLSKKMHHLIPNSEILVIKKASHVALIEQPALINLRIEKFINERL